MTAQQTGGPDGGFDADDLIRRAWVARDGSYSPYTGFAVGAAVLTDRGVYTGANVENAAYPSGICAERVAIGAAVADGARHVDAVAVVASSPDPVSPCGQCRQVIREFGPSAVVVSEGTGSGRKRWTLQELLPDSFGPEALGRSTP